MTKLVITETGKGVGRTVGDTVYCSENGSLYKITGVSSIVRTRVSGNFTYADGECVGNAADLSDDEFDALPDASASLLRGRV